MLTLFECYVPVLAYIETVLTQSSPPPAGMVRNEVLALLDVAKNDARKNGFSENIFSEGLFPVVAWLDETLMCAHWDGAREWRNHLLQRSFFGLSNFGVEFYRRIHVLESEHKQSTRSVLEIYYYVLQLGFKGQYGFGRQEHEIVRIRKNIQSLIEPHLTETVGKSPLHGSQPANREVGGSDNGRKRRVLAGVAFYLVPPAIVLVLYGVFSWMIDQTTDSILSHLR